MTADFRINPFEKEKFGMKRYSYNGKTFVGHLVEIRGMFLVFRDQRKHEYFINANQIGELTSIEIPADKVV